MGIDRMNLAKQSLILFIRSLPEKCRFEVISFGHTYDYLNINGKEKAVEYNTESRDTAIRIIEHFSSNYGGTDILNPLIDASKSAKKSFG